MSDVVGKRKSRLSLNSSKNSVGDEDGQIRIFSFFPKLTSQEVFRQRSSELPQLENADDDTPKNARKKKKRSRKDNEDRVEKMKENDDHKNQKGETARNAFIIMMDNRKKSIGQNSNGKELEKFTEPIEIHDENRSSKLAARKIMLQEWADKRGATKRKIEDEEKGIAIKHKLKQRAKRFKDILTNGEIISLTDLDSNNLKNGNIRSTRSRTLPKWRMRIKVNLSDDEIEKSLIKNNANDPVAISNLNSNLRNPQIPTPLIVNEPQAGSETTVACRNFTESGIPETRKKKTENERLEELTCQLFPKKSHIKVQYDWDLPAVDINFTNERLYSRNVGLLSLGSITDLKAQAEVVTRTDRIDYGGCKKIMKQLKVENPNYPINKVFKCLFRKSKQQAQSRMWTDLYKPCTSEEMLGNKKSLNEFKAWLRSRKYKRFGSDLEFEGIDDDSGSSSRLRQNAVILCGPHGSGKTTAAYALCNEFDIDVLELNASSKRTGKRLLNELQEATQSHQLNKTQTFLKKRKRPDSTNKISLILVEDVDIVFDQDENFTNALSQLLLTSKRPVVLTTTDANCLHLKKFFDQYPTITFNEYSSKVLSLWLQIVCLAEGSLIDKRLIDELLDCNEGDVRRTLLRLQFFAQTGGIRTLNFDCKSTPLNLRGVWWNLADSLGIERPLSCDTNEKREIKKLDDAVNVLEALSVIDVAYRKLYFQSNLESTHKNSCKILKDSLDLMESNEEHDLSKGVICDWSRTLMEGYMVSSYYCAVMEKRWRNNQVKCKNWFLPVISNGCHSDRRSIDVDYLPTLRTMVRSEGKRSTFSNKRGNRFFNYLSGLGVSYNDAHFKIMCDTFGNHT